MRVLVLGVCIASAQSGCSDDLDFDLCGVTQVQSGCPDDPELDLCSVTEVQSGCPDDPELDLCSVTEVQNGCLDDPDIDLCDLDGSKVTEGEQESTEEGVDSALRGAGAPLLALAIALLQPTSVQRGGASRMALLSALAAPTKASQLNSKRELPLHTQVFSVTKDNQLDFFHAGVQLC